MVSYLTEIALYKKLIIVQEIDQTEAIKANTHVFFKKLMFYAIKTKLVCTLWARTLSLQDKKIQ